MKESNKASNGKAPYKKSQNLGTLMNGPRTKSKLTKDGLVFKNNLLDTDTTSQNTVARKLKGV